MGEGETSREKEDHAGGDFRHPPHSLYLNGLEVGNGRAECLALLGVVNGALKGGLRDSEGLARNADAAAVKGLLWFDRKEEIVSARYRSSLLARSENCSRHCSKLTRGHPSRALRAESAQGKAGHVHTKDQLYERAQ